MCMRARHLIAAILMLPPWVGMSADRQFAAHNSALRQPPEDLLLSPAEVRRTQALSHFAKGLFLQMQDADFDAYQEHFYKALVLQPQSSAFLQVLLTPWTMSRNYEAIRTHLSPVAQAHPEITHLQLIYSATLQAADRTPEAIDHLGNLFYRRAVRDPRLVRELYALLWQTGDTEGVDRLLRHAQRDPALRNAFITNYALAHYHFASARQLENEGPRRAAAMRREKRIALRHARRALENGAEVESIRDVDHLIEIFEAFDEYDKIIRLLREARGRLPEYSLGLQLQLATYYEETGSPDTALELLEGIDINTISNPSFLTRYGQQMLILNQSRQAESAFRRALAIAPDDARIRLPLSHFWLHLGNPAKAVEMLEPLTNLPASSLLVMSQAYRETNELDAALDYLERAEAAAAAAGDSDFMSARIYLYKASLFIDRDDVETAIAILRDALDRYPANGRVNNFLGYVLADHNRELTEAERMIAVAVAQDPDNDAYLDSLAWVYYRQGRYEKALRWINKALHHAQGVPDPVILDHAGDIYAANGYPLLAIEYWWNAIEAGADEPDAIRAKIEQFETADAGSATSAQSGISPK